MLHKTPDSLATLPNARLIRRYDAVRRVWHLTRSENTARRCACRMSTLSDAARWQEITRFMATAAQID